MIYYLKEGQTDEWKRRFHSIRFADDLEHAYELMKDVEPLHPAEYILKGVVNAAYGQEHDSVNTRRFEEKDVRLSLVQRDHVKMAQSYFQLVGGSASECGKWNDDEIS